MDKYIGKKLDGRYEIQELVGVGGMANVYKALDVAEDRAVAVKILREEFQDNEEFLRRFNNESKAIAMLNHPNIVKVYDVMMASPTKYIVMEYIDGISLKEYMDQQGLMKWKEAVYFTVQILRGLQHAHDRGIVHRDIKPQNIMLLYDGTIKITDFGIARFARAETKTITDRAIGSVHYISPEQARGEATDEKTDIYSVGVMLFEMLTGKLPFEADNAVSVAIKQIQSIPKRPREINPDIPEGLEAITIRAMQKDVNKRYHSAAEMLRDIDEFKRNPSVNFEYTYLSEPAPQEIAGAINRKRSLPQQAVQRRRRVSVQQPAASRKTAYNEEDDMKVVHRTPVLPILAGVAGAFLLVSSLFIFWLFYTNNPFKEVEQVKLPNFIGEKYATVDQKYHAQFKLEKEDAYSDKYERGVVLEQVPKSGRRVRLGSTITLKVSLGTQTIIMEDYAGMMASEVMVKLKALGLEAVESNIKHPNIPKGCVIKTDPPKGSEITTETPITVYVSTGGSRPMATVPNIVGMNKEDAKAAILMNRLRVGTITSVSYSQLEGSSTVSSAASSEASSGSGVVPPVAPPEVGTVISQNPTADGENDGGRMVPEGSTVSMSVYSGNSTVVRLSVPVKVPQGFSTAIKMTAQINDKVVKTASVDTAKEKQWPVLFESEYEVETAYIYIDGALYQELELNFKSGKHSVVKDYSGDFASGGGITVVPPSSSSKHEDKSSSTGGITVEPSDNEIIVVE
ncbi:MAG: Stk1 family PASTA domain-containing Ser/Thr kinase [Hydrogenoanaerobacterium sp.]